MKGVNVRLLGLHIDGFGKFHDRTLSFTDGVNVIYGKNEAGKSTIHTFIRAMLFGLERGRGRAAKNDTYSRYEPWENRSEYEGWLEVESEGTVYRIERIFGKENRSLTVVNETKGLPEEPTKELFDEILGGLDETAYDNTISIGQLKSATDDSMVGELKNYIANMNNTGDVSLNITKASAYLKNQKKNLEAGLVPDASKEYTALMSEIKTLDNEVTSPEYENKLTAYEGARADVGDEIETAEADREALSKKAAESRSELAENGFSDRIFVEAAKAAGDNAYARYTEAKQACGEKSGRVVSIIDFVLAVLGAITALYLGATASSEYIFLAVICGAAAIACLVLGIVFMRRDGKLKSEMEEARAAVSDIFKKRLGNPEVSDEALASFDEKMNSFLAVADEMEESENSERKSLEKINGLREKQNSFSEQIEQQQRKQWELDKKLERLSACRTQAEALERTINENDRIREDIAAVDLAQETMTELSSSIRDSFGLYLNKEASGYIKGLTNGVYDSMSVDEDLNVFLNTPNKLVPLESVSSGTMDQVYLALRLASANLLRGDGEAYPLIFDDSFAQYDDERLASSLKWLSENYDGQMLIFTCHTREADVLDKEGVEYNYVHI